MRGILPVESVCSICKKSLTTTVLRGVEADLGVYDVCMCSDCMVAATVPMPSREDLTRLYSSGSYRSSEGSRFNALIEFFIYLSRLRRKKRITKFVKRGRILDIGCGRGLSLDIMRRDGWSVAGVEFSRESASCASETYGIDVASGAPGEWGFPAEHFDVITMNHVLEHLEEPPLMVEECRRLLRKGGLLVCAVPDISSLQATVGKEKWFHLDLPYHIHHFTESGLIRLLDMKGFDVVKITRLDLEYGPFGWLQTLLNLSGIRKNFLYNLLKGRELRERELANISARDAVLTFLLLPFYLPLGLVLSVFESYVLKRGGTVTVYGVRT